MFQNKTRQCNTEGQGKVEKIGGYNSSSEWMHVLFVCDFHKAFEPLLRDLNKFVLKNNENKIGENNDWEK